MSLTKKAIGIEIYIFTHFLLSDIQHSNIFLQVHIILLTYIKMGDNIGINY